MRNGNRVRVMARAWVRVMVMVLFCSSIAHGVFKHCNGPVGAVAPIGTAMHA